MLIENIIGWIVVTSCISYLIGEPIRNKKNREFDLKHTHKGTSNDNVIEEFENFLKISKDKKKAYAIVYIPEKGSYNQYPVVIHYEDLDILRQAIRNNDFKNIIGNINANYEYMGNTYNYGYSPSTYFTINFIKE